MGGIYEFHLGPTLLIIILGRRCIRDQILLYSVFFYSIKWKCLISSICYSLTYSYTIRFGQLVIIINSRSISETRYMRHAFYLFHSVTFHLLKGLISRSFSQIKVKAMQCHLDDMFHLFKACSLQLVLDKCKTINFLDGFDWEADDIRSEKNGV